MFAVKYKFGTEIRTYCLFKTEDGATWALASILDAGFEAWVEEVD